VLAVLPDQVVDTTDGLSPDGSGVSMMVVHVKPVDDNRTFGTFGPSYFDLKNPE
jgi:hypothetical protein